MQEATPISFSKFEPSKENITFRPMRNIEGANKTVHTKRATLLYNGQPLWIQTPKMHAPFGVSRGKKDEQNYNKKISVSLNLEKGDENSTYSKMLRFQELIIDAIYENRFEWLPPPQKKTDKRPEDVTRAEIVEHMFYPFISEPKEKSTYEPIMRGNLTTTKKEDGTVDKIVTAVWSDKRERVMDVTDASIPSRSNLKLIMGVPYVYYLIGTKKFGVIWRVHSLQVFPGAGLPADGCFFDDQDVEEGEVEAEASAVSEPVATSAPVPAPVPAPSRKPVVSTSQPTPAPVESSDEEDDEPVAPPVATPKPSLTVKSRKQQASQ